MRTLKRTCPKCGAQLKYNDIMSRGPSFPCPSCGTELQVPDSYAVLILIGSIVVPALAFWALGFGWETMAIGTVLAFWPVFYFTARYIKYVIPPKPEPYLPMKAELRLRDGPRQ